MSFVYTRHLQDVQVVYSMSKSSTAIVTIYQVCFPRIPTRPWSVQKNRNGVQQRISPFSSEGGEATGEILLQKMREHGPTLWLFLYLRVFIKEPTSARGVSNIKIERHPVRVVFRRNGFSSIAFFFNFTLAHRSTYQLDQEERTHRPKILRTYTWTNTLIVFRRNGFSSIAFFLISHWRIGVPTN